ncbi:MAG: DUF4142 domain-containing protein [Lautropia sp.]
MTSSIRIAGPAQCRRPMRIAPSLALAAAVCVSPFVALAQGTTGQGNTAPGGGAASSQSSQSSQATAPARGSGGREAAELSAADRAFMTKAAQGGAAEVEMGKLAQRNAERDDVRRFGERMVEDHGKANEALARVARAHDMKLPSTPDSKAKSTMKTLESKQGKAFDRAYMDHMVADHNKDVAAFEKAAKSSGSPDVQAFAKDTLQVLEEHRKMARDIAGERS